MTPERRIHFTKMHGAGNDYIYVDVNRYPISNPAAAAIAWSDRHKGIGADGLVLIGRSTMPEADFTMRIFNADGSEARMCGNASRCIGRYVTGKGLTDKREIRLLTLSGVKTLKVGDEDIVVDMGKPMLADEKLYLPTGSLPEGTFVSMGNPHYVIFTEEVDRVGELGQALTCHPAFPEQCNIELAHVMADGTVRTRVWERGSGVTMACGTGACATAVAAIISGRAERQVRVSMDGGVLGVEWNEADGHVYLSGPAEFAFEGEVVLTDKLSNRR